jgi:hypothetical protein
MARHDSVPHVSPSERFEAWLVTGPPGHLYGTLADIVVLWTRWGVTVARLRLRPGERNSS